MQDNSFFNSKKDFVASEENVTFFFVFPGTITLK